MTINTTINRTVQTANGVTTVWNYSFLIPDASEVVVQVANIATGVVTTLTNLQYSITGIGNPNGGTVTISPAVAVGNTITIQRIMALVQSTSLANQGALYPAVIESALDYVTMIAQQLNDGLGRALVGSANGLGFLDAQTQRIANVVDPVNAQDAATKTYVDAKSFAAGNVPAPGTPFANKFLAALTASTWGWVQPAFANLSGVIAGAQIAAGTIVDSMIAWADATETVASATASTDLPATVNQYVLMSGSATIAGLGTMNAGTRRRILATGAWKLTNSPTLICLGGVDYQAAAGDIIEVESQGAGTWRMMWASRASGLPVVNPTITQINNGGGLISVGTGTSVDVTGLTGAKRIEIDLFGISSTGAAAVPTVQLGSGSVQTTGYVDQYIYQTDAPSNNCVSGITNGFTVMSISAATQLTSAKLILTHVGNNVWTCMFTGMRTVTANFGATAGFGWVTLSGGLDRFRITFDGVATFDAGSYAYTVEYQ